MPWSHVARHRLHLPVSCARRTGLSPLTQKTRKEAPGTQPVLALLFLPPPLLLLLWHSIVQSG